jgi:hypothetical protein
MAKKWNIKVENLNLYTEIDNSPLKEQKGRDKEAYI